MLGNGDAPISPPGDAGTEFKGLVDLGGGCGGGPPVLAEDPGLIVDCVVDSCEAVVVV